MILKYSEKSLINEENLTHARALGGHGVQIEGFVGVVFPDDALGVVFLNPSLPDVG